MVKNTRIEKDALGEVEVDKDALYGCTPFEHKITSILQMTHSTLK